MALALLVFFATRVPGGLVHDARIYVGRALADLDPTGVGRDALFAYDGQTAFTVYGRLLEPLVRAFGAEAAAYLASAFAVGAWAAGAAALAWRLNGRRLVPAALVCVAIMPATYGALDVFRYAEPFATPRGLAEALVLAALAALLARRHLVSAAALAGAAALHAPTALPGLTVAAVVAGWGGLRGPASALTSRVAPQTGRRAVAAARTGVLVVGCLAGVLALHGFCRAGLAGRFSPEWEAAVRIRNPYLYPSLWPPGAWSRAGVSLGVVSLAGLAARGRRRFFFLVSASLAVGATFATWLFGELDGGRLILQLQPWRSLWLVTAIGPLALPRLSRSLQRRLGVWAWPVLACLGLAEFVANTPEVALPAILVAAALAALAPRWRDHPRTSALAAGGIALIAGGLALAAGAAAWVGVSVAVKAVLARGLEIPSEFVAALLLPPPIVLGLTLWLASGSTQGRRVGRLGFGIAIASAAVVAGCLWLRAAEDARRRADGSAADALRAALGDPSRGVIVLDGEVVLPWLYARAPTWSNTLHGTAGVFSSELAKVWRDRSGVLLRSGLVSADYATLRSGEHSPPPLRADGLTALCRRPDAPSAVMAGGDQRALLPPGSALVWRSPGPARAGVTVDHGAVVARGHQLYTIVRCAAFARIAGRR